MRISERELCITHTFKRIDLRKRIIICETTQLDEETDPLNNMETYNLLVVQRKCITGNNTTVTRREGKRQLMMVIHPWTCLKKLREEGFSRYC